MQPIFKAGEQVIIFNWAYFFVSPKIGDVVVISHQGQYKIKRIHNVDDHRIFVVGDNEKESTDSRHFGAIKREQIIGKVVYKW